MLKGFSHSTIATVIFAPQRMGCVSFNVSVYMVYKLNPIQPITCEK